MNPHLLIDSLDGHGWDCDLLTRRHHGQDLNPDSIPSHLRYSTVPSSKLGPRRRVRHLVLRDLLHRHLPMSPLRGCLRPSARLHLSLHRHPKLLVGSGAV